MSSIDTRSVFHIRVPRELQRDIDHIAVDWDTFRNEAVVRLLRFAVEAHRSGQAKIFDAAERESTS